MWLGCRFGVLWQVTAIKSGLSFRGVFGKQVHEELVGFFALAACGFKQAAQDAVIFQSFLRAGAVDDFAHDDDRAQTALGLIIGGRDVGPAEAGEELLLLRAGEAFAEGLGFGVA